MQRSVVLAVSSKLLAVVSGQSCWLHDIEQSQTLQKLCLPYDMSQCTWKAVFSPGDSVLLHSPGLWHGGAFLVLLSQQRVMQYKVMATMLRAS